MTTFVRRFVIPVYGTRMMLIVTDDMKATLATLPKRFRHTDADATARALTYPVLDGRMIIIFDARHSTRIVNSMFHEVWHVTNEMMRYYNVKYCEKSDEAFAYVQGVVGERLWEALQEWTTRKETTNV